MPTEFAADIPAPLVNLVRSRVSRRHIHYHIYVTLRFTAALTVGVEFLPGGLSGTRLVTHTGLDAEKLWSIPCERLLQDRGDKEVGLRPGKSVRRSSSMTKRSNRSELMFLIASLMLSSLTATSIAGISALVFGNVAIVQCGSAITRCGSNSCLIPADGPPQVGVMPRNHVLHGILVGSTWSKQVTNSSVLSTDRRSFWEQALGIPWCFRTRRQKPGIWQSTGHTGRPDPLIRR